MAIYSTGGTAPAAFPVSPSFSIPFEPRTILIVNEDTTLANYVEFSLDGVNVHGRLTPTVLGSLVLSQHVLNVWIRRGAGTPVVRIIAES